MALRQFLQFVSSVSKSVFFRKKTINYMLQINNFLFLYLSCLCLWTRTCVLRFIFFSLFNIEGLAYKYFLNLSFFVFQDKFTVARLIERKTQSLQKKSILSQTKLNHTCPMVLKNVFFFLIGLNFST